MYHSGKLSEKCGYNIYDYIAKHTIMEILNQSYNQELRLSISIKKLLEVPNSCIEINNEIHFHKMKRPSLMTPLCATAYV